MFIFFLYHYSSSNCYLKSLVYTTQHLWARISIVTIVKVNNYLLTFQMNNKPHPNFSNQGSHSLNWNSAKVCCWEKKITCSRIFLWVASFVVMLISSVVLPRCSRQYYDYKITNCCNVSCHWIVSHLLVVYLNKNCVGQHVIFSISIMELIL